LCRARARAIRAERPAADIGSIGKGRDKAGARRSATRRATAFFVAAASKGSRVGTAARLRPSPTRDEKFLWHK
jgi:hypothetical protein